MTPRVRRRWIAAASLLALPSALALGAWSCMIRMPGKSFDGPLPPRTDAQKGLAAELKRDVVALASEIGVRDCFSPERLDASLRFLERRFREAGLVPVREAFQAAGTSFANLSGEIAGKASSKELVLIGAHYDSVEGCPAANDNASGVAALLALAKRLAASKPDRTLRFVAFANEEPPHFQTDGMGSRVCARNCRARGEKIVAMLSLETMGYYSDVDGSQAYPAPLSFFYPTKGDFIAFVGNVGSRALVRRCVGGFRKAASFPSEGAALPGFLPGVGWSDHWSFWEEGFPAVMVTDTAVFRYPHYHTRADTPDKLDYERFARVVDGLVPVVAELAGASAPSSSGSGP
jgi:hypothetical protein